jgi:hypothetical protein
MARVLWQPTQESAPGDLVYSLVHITITWGKYNRPKAAVLRQQYHPITTSSLQSTRPRHRWEDNIKMDLRLNRVEGC